MKKGLNLISFLILSLLVLSLFSIAISAQLSKQAFDKDNAETYSDNLEQLSTLMKTESGRDSVNTALSKATPEIKNKILEELAIKLSKDKIAASKSGSLLSGITSLFGGKKTETKETLIQVEKLTGFGSSKLKFYDNKLIGDGKIFLNIEKIPNGATEIEYNEKEGKFVLRFKGNEKSKYGGELITESGIIEDNKIIDKNKREIEFSWNSLNEITSKILVDKDGKFILTGKAEISFNGKTFSLNDKIPELFIPYIRSSLEKDSLWQKAIVEIIDDAHFRVSGYAKVTSDNAVVRTFGKDATDVIFKSGDYSQFSKYIQLDGNKINIGNKNGERFSDFIDLELTKSLKDSAGKDISYEIKGNGKGIFIENGERLYEVDGENIKTLREIQESSFSLKLLNEQSGKTLEDDSSIVKDGEKRVCIGGSCLVGGLGVLFGTSKPEVNVYEYEGTGLISRTLVYADSKEIESFMESLKQEETKLGRKLTQEEFKDRLSSSIGNAEIAMALQMDLAWSKFEENLNEELNPLRFSQEQMQKINEFKSTVKESLQNSKIPSGSKMSIITQKKENAISGVFTITINGKVNTLMIDEEALKIYSLVQRRLKTNALNSVYLWNKYNGQ